MKRVLIVIAAAIAVFIVLPVAAHAWLVWWVSP